MAIDYDEKFYARNKMKEYIRNNGIVPIISDKFLYIYKFSPIENIQDVIKHMHDKYDGENYCINHRIKSYSSLYFEGKWYFNHKLSPNIIRTEPLSIEEYKCLFKNYKDRYESLKKRVPYIDYNCSDSFVPTLYRFQTLDEYIEEDVENFEKRYYVQLSRLAKLLELVSVDFDIDIIYKIFKEARNKCDEDEDIIYLGSKYWTLGGMPFTNIEKSMECEELGKCFKTFMSSFNIECIFCKHVDTVTESEYFEFMGDYSEDLKKEFISFSDHYGLCDYLNSHIKFLINETKEKESEKKLTKLIKSNE